MQTHNLNLLKALGCKIPEPGSGVNRYPCPLHNDGAHSLRIHENPATGISYFDCTNPVCRFFGDAVTLVSAVRKLSIADTLMLFRPGGTLADTLKEPLLDSEVAAYTESRVAQSRIQAYLSRCQQALRQTPERCRLRSGLSSNCLRLVPQEIGLLLHGDDVPAPFKEFNRSKYQRATHTIYPFTYNGEVTHVRIQDADDTIISQAVTITRSDIGVFMERFDTSPARLVATFDPRTAAVIYGNCMAETSRKPPIVAIAGFPLPESLASVAHIYLLSTPDHPLTLADALMTLAVPDYVAGTTIQPQIRVWWMPRSAETVTAELVRTRLEGSSSNTTPLDLWALNEMERLAVRNNPEEIYKALGAATLPEGIRTSLLQRARDKNMSPAVIEALQTVSTSSMSRLILGNGRVIRRAQTNLKAVNRAGEETVLCNVGIQVSHKIQAYDGEEILVCKITAADTAIAPLVVHLPERSWSRASAIQKIITKAFAARGQTPYVACYDVRGYSWYDILGKLAEQCELHHEVRELGLDDAAALHMPNFVLRTTSRTLDQQKQIFTMPDSTLQAYAGIPGALTLSPREPFRNLFEHCDNLYVAAFTCGLMHAVFQLTCNLYRVEQAKKQAQRHLLYVETETGIWHSVFHQLATFFSDSDYVPILNFADPQTTLNEYRQLGQLPLIARVPALRGDKLPRALSESGVSLIGLVDSTTAVYSHGYRLINYVTPASEQPVTTSVIDPQDIDDLRQAFAGFMLDYLVNVPIDSAYRTTHTPALAAYRCACNLVGVEPSPLVQRILKVHYPSAAMTGVNIFFDILHRELHSESKKPWLCVVHGKPSEDVSFTDRGQHVFVTDEVVVISHAIIELLNHESHAINKFTEEQLTQELNERKLLADTPEWLTIDTNRCWVLPRDVWDAQVLRPPLLLPEQVTYGNIIQLDHIA